MLRLGKRYAQIMEDIDFYEIPIYNFPYDLEEDDEDTIADNMELRVCTVRKTTYRTYPIFV